MKPTQHRALQALHTALHTATNTGLLDLLQPDCNNPDSINDLADAVQALLTRAAQESDEEEGPAESGADFGAYTIPANQAIDDLVSGLEEEIRGGETTDGDLAMAKFISGMREIAEQHPQATDTSVKEAAWGPIQSLLEARGLAYDRMRLYGW